MGGFACAFYYAMKYAWEILIDLVYKLIHYFTSQKIIEIVQNFLMNIFKFVVNLISNLNKYLRIKMSESSHLHGKKKIH